MKKQPELIIPWETDRFKKAWEEWKEFRKDTHKFKYKTAKSEQAALNELALISMGSEEVALRIIQKSMASGWRGLFKLKNDEHDAIIRQQSGDSGPMGFAKRISGIQ